MARSTDDCIDEVAAAGGGMSRGEARQVLQQIADRGDRTGDYAAAARDMVDRAEAAKVIEKRNQLINLKNRIVRRERIEGRVEELTNKFGKEGLLLAIENEVIAKNTVVGEGRLSAEAEAKAKGSWNASQAMLELERAGLADPLRNNRDFARLVGKEVYQLSKQGAGEAATPGVTKNAAAQKAAGILYKFQNLTRNALNRAGAWVGDYAGYITRTTHDPVKMIKAGFETWRDFILPLLDHDRTFEGATDIDKVLRHTFDALYTGIHLSDEGTVGFKDPAFHGPGNMAGKLSESRELHFKDDDAWLDYQERFGSGSLAEQFETAFRRAGKQQALLERWGTNPRAEFEQDIQYFKERYRDRNPDAAKYLSDGQAGLMTKFSYLDGRNNIPVHELAANISQGLRNIQSMSKLGFVSFTHLYSMAAKVAEMHYQGVGWLEGWGNVLSSLREGAHGAGDKAELYDLLLAGFDGQHGHYLSRFTLDDSMPGMMSKATSTTMKWSGLEYILDAEKAGTKMMIARNLGRQLDKSYADLQPEVRRAFIQYGISEADWAALRSVQDHFHIEDRAFLTPDAAARATPETLAEAWKDRRNLAREGTSEALANAFPDREPTSEEMSRYAEDLGLKLHTYYSDIADRSVITPGIAEKALMFGDNRPGTVLGESLRFMAQFKAWPLAAVRQGLGREWYGNDTTGAAVKGLLSLVVASTVLGYARMATTDLIKGLNPRDPKDPKTIAAAMLQGGGLGILGDYLFGEFGRNHQNFYETMAGPVFGTGIQLLDVWNKMKDAALNQSEKPLQSVPPELFRVALDNTPFINMFYARTALNYLLFWRIQEAMNPGFQRRYERRVQRERGQTFWLSPAQAVGR